MKLLFIIATIIVSIIGTQSGEKLLSTQWYNFKVAYHKQYKSEEEERLRMKIFNENLKKIEQHNELYKNGSQTYALGINQFADMTKDEFSAFLHQYPKKQFNFANSRIKLNITASFKQAPPSFDWRDKGKVTKVKFQGYNCGSCWAHGAIGAIESAYAIKTGQLVDLSEQNLVDCSREWPNLGCNGGHPYVAMEHISKYGINLEGDYPYEAKDGPCRFNTSNKVFKIIGPKLFRARDEEELVQILYANGPISVSIVAKGSLQLYNDGLYLNEDCDGSDKENINHVVLLVGYGTSSSGQYWIIKNTWGPTWGENGYMLLPRNRNNSCGILIETILPII